MKLSGALFALSVPIAALAANVSTIDVPGPLGVGGTAPQAINSLGAITGFSLDAAGVAHGFLLWKGKFTTIGYPGALQTSPRGINNEGDVVGQFDNGPASTTSGFIREENGTFRKVDYPGATATGLFGMNEREQIVGNYQDSAGVSHGFLLEHGNYTAINPPGAVGGVTATGINNLGDTVGFFISATGPQGFLRTPWGAYKTINVPGAVDSRARGINDLGEIAGQFKDSAGTTHAFRLSWGVFTTIDAPNAAATFGRGINDFAAIVGNYNDKTTGALHGFLATK